MPCISHFFRWLASWGMVLLGISLIRALPSFSKAVVWLGNCLGKSSCPSDQLSYLKKFSAFCPYFAYLRIYLAKNSVARSINLATVSVALRQFFWLPWQVGIQGRESPVNELLPNHHKSVVKSSEV